MELDKFSDIRRRSVMDLHSQVAVVRRLGEELSIAEYIRAWMAAPVGLGLGSTQVRKVDAVYEASEQSRAASGRAPEGVWVPLAALTRDLSSTSDAGLQSLESTAGVYHGSSLQAALMPASAVLGSATILTGLQGGDFDLLAVQTGVDPSTQWQSEISAQSATDPVFRPVSMVAKTLRFNLTVSRLVMMNQKLNMEAALRAEILRRVIAEVDRGAFNGSGASNEPLGLFNNASIDVQAAGTNGLAPAWDHLVELEYQVGSRVGEPKAPHFITSPKLRKKLRRTPKAAGLDFILAGASSEVMGNPLRTSTVSPDNLTKGTSSGVCSALMYGDLSELVVGFFGPAAVDITVDPVTRADKGEVRLLVRCDMAVAPRNIGAFSVYKDLLSA